MKRFALVVFVSLVMLGLWGCTRPGGSNTTTNLPPVAEFTVTAEEVAPFVEIVFDASSSSDPDGTIVEYRWEFGDGGEDEGMIVTYSYFEVGTYRVRLTVRDDQGATATAEKTVTVREPPETNQPPVARFTFRPPMPRAGEEIVFDASSSYDPDGVIVQYLWDFGDGIEAEGKVARHIYTEPGTYWVILVVIDNYGEEEVAEEEIEVF